MSIAAFLAAALLCTMAAISPGPAVLMAARIGLQQGLRTGAALAVGIAAGAVFWAVAAVFGLSLLFEYAPALLIALKILGAAYLIWMAVKMWRHASDPIEDSTSPTGLTPLRAFRLGFTTQLANPKPAVFFGAVFIGTLPADATTLSVFALLCVIFCVEFTWNTFVARLFSLERTRNAYLGLKHIIDRIFGGLLAALGVKIAAG
ncbi:LysE family transporter [Thalassobius sp. I31.1]|uniref:LysE family translocator n=1 Tax=Thalassobius sp. I31.1 TaxID=2109912 RepID=UPI000D1BEC84|nr:LysE family transporter [Thalassobius sp. I31.1]